MKLLWITLLLLAISSFFTLRTKASILRVCIQNCGQCKRMYGDYFLGQQCAEECLQTVGSSMPDCIKVSSFRRFLGRSRKHVASQSRLGLSSPQLRNHHRN